MAHICCNRKDGTVQIEDATASGHADGLVQGTIDHTFGQKSTGLSLVHSTNISSLEHKKDPLVLNAVSSVNESEKNPSLCPAMENMLCEGSSASNTTTTAVGESEAMRKWKEIKQNGFLSHPHGGMPTQPTEPVKKKRVRRHGGHLHPPGGMPPPQHGKGSVSLSHSPGGIQKPPSQHGNGSISLSHPRGAMSMSLPPPSQCSEGSSFLSHPPGGMLMPPLLQGKGSSFLSYPQSGILRSPPQPGKQHETKQSKRKEVDFKGNTEAEKRERKDKFKSAPPSGLLSGLNIGIIWRIRSQKEVCAFLDAMVQSEIPATQTQNTSIIQVDSGSEDQNQLIQYIDRAPILVGSEQRGKKRASDNAEERSHSQNNVTSSRLLVTDQILTSSMTVSSDIASRLHGQTPLWLLPKLSTTAETGKSLDANDAVETISRESATGSLCGLDHNKKLPSAVTRPSEIITKACGGHFSTEQENMFSLTKKGATYAFEWLEFLHKDIKGRLETLRCSKEKVTEAIYKQLPDLASSHYRETDSVFWQCSGTHCFSRWMALFNKFHTKLCEEEKLLEKKLREIQEMLLHCDVGLRYFDTEELPQGQQFASSEKFRKSTKTEDLAAQHAVQAAAAAIYSSCSFVMRKSDAVDL